MPFVLAAGTVPPFFIDVAALLVCGALIAYIGYRLKLVPIVGFLVTGVIIGPHALGLVANQELVDATAQVGVILLLFTIGIEFSLEKLARIKKLIFGGGGLQVGLAALTTLFLLMAFGVPWQAGLFTGFLVALSSTAIVLKLLASRGETNTEPGQASPGILIFQDLAIIVLVLPVPMLDVRYEELVDDQAAVSRRIVDFVDLEWDPACLEFHANRRAVQTSSALQVRRPIYRDSIERWRVYQAELQPLIEALGDDATIDD